MRNNFKKSVLFILVFALILTSSSTLVFGQEVQLQQVEQTGEINLQQELEFLGKLLMVIKANYAYEVTEEQLLEGAMKGLFYNLDDYSSYYTKEEFKELNETVTGDFGGVGLNITVKNNYITVITSLEGTPSFKAGILPEDVIISVDDIDIRQFTSKQAADIIRGEPGTEVKLGIMREGKKEVLYFNLIREIIKINSVEYKTLENNIGYIKITEFNKHTLKNIHKALEKFDLDKIDKIIFDVRNNPGGSLNEVVKTLRLFVPKGPIVHVKYADGRIQTYKSYNEEVKYKTVVLVNKGSASASEIFAGAIQDTGVGTIIGNTTFGKGTVQSIRPLVNGGGIKLTVAEYFTVNKNPVNKIGIEPDIIIDNNLNEDLQLKKAIEVLRKQK